MRSLIILILSIFCTCVTAQNTEVVYDSDIIELIGHKWNNPNSEFQGDANAIEEYERIQTFFMQLDLMRTSLVSDTFLMKPSDNLLVANYLNLKLQWNAFNPAAGLKKLSTKKVIKNTVSELPKRYEMLAFYYLTIFGHTLNNNRPLDLSSLNIDLENLKLHNETEKAILFLCAMRHLGRQVFYYSSINFPDNCFRALDYVEHLPKFNGRPFYEYELPPIEDFKIRADKRYPKVSFKEHYKNELDNARTGYARCLNQNND